MKTCKELENRWNSCHGGQILVDHTHPLKMYLSVNEKSNKELLVPISTPVRSFHSTEAIGINNYRHGNAFLFSIELKTEKLEKEFICLCFDLIESSRKHTSENESRTTFLDTFKKWYSLLATAASNRLSIQEIRGLMGELKYIIDEIENGVEESKLINAWTTHKDACRDFIFDNCWDEVKTITTTSDFITISSLEQLEHDSNGRLIVYRLDKDETGSSASYTLNSLVEELKKKLSIELETELCRKLLIKGYVFDEIYNSFMFLFTQKNLYTVNESFPRISRSSIPRAVSAAKYELQIKQLEEWRIE